MTLRRVTDTVDVYVGCRLMGTMPTHTHRVPSLARRVSRTFSGVERKRNVSAPRASARGRWRAAVAVVRAHGLVGTPAPRVGSRRARVTNERISKRRC